MFATLFNAKARHWQSCSLTRYVGARQSSNVGIQFFRSLLTFTASFAVHRFISCFFGVPFSYNSRFCYPHAQLLVVTDSSKFIPRSYCINALSRHHIKTYAEIMNTMSIVFVRTYFNAARNQFPVLYILIPFTTFSGWRRPRRCTIIH